MDPISQQIHVIHDKVKQLATQLEQLRQQNSSLLQENATLKQTNAQQAATLTDMEEKLKTLQIAKGVSVDEEKTALKLKINEYIREIDKCIAMLNT